MRKRNAEGHCLQGAAPFVLQWACLPENAEMGSALPSSAGIGCGDASAAAVSSFPSSEKGVVFLGDCAKIEVVTLRVEPMRSSICM